MGYYVDMEESNLIVPAEHYAAAYEALCRLNWLNHLKHGGGWPREDIDGPHPNVWYSWLDWNYHETCDNLEAVLRHVGFDTWDHNGMLWLTGYSDKSGDEDVFLEALSPFYSHDDGTPFAEWHGEDGDRWRIEYLPTHWTVRHAVKAWAEIALHSYRVN